MGKGYNKNDEQARERRLRMEQEEKKKKQRQNRITYGFLGGLVGLIVIGVVVALIVTNAGGKKKKGSGEQTAETDVRSAPAMGDIDLSDVDDTSVFTVSESATDYVRLTVSYTEAGGAQKQGDIYIRLFPDVAPGTVENFKTLVESGFYDGLTFHRIMPGFMIQGGDPKGDGTGDSGTRIKGEFDSNGFENNLSHVRGVLSMARGSYSMDSASCQFFIMHKDSTFLDGDYAAFGYVVGGMDVVDAITEVELITVDSQTKTPVYPVTIESAVFVTK